MSRIRSRSIRSGAAVFAALSVLTSVSSCTNSTTDASTSTTGAGAVTTTAAAMFDQATALVEGDPLRVRTDAGVLRGQALEGVRRFSAIPYAAPPVGENRWREPQPAPTWSGERDATTTPNSCPQVLPVVNLSQGSEDCLFLNVFSPGPAPKTLQPVMVWIHGGGFTVGSGLDNDPSMMVAKAGVVVVSINYRLGPFGFLSRPELAAAHPDHATGNLGFEDQIAALKWVKASIAKFGGNPANVTIFGESAGGMSVCDHLLSPKSRGLFSKAIIESGPCGGAGVPKQPALDQGREFAARLGCPEGTDTMSCLRSKSTQQIMDAFPPDPTFLFRKAAFWLPVADGVDLPVDGAKALAAGRFNRVPLISGVNRDEGRLFIGLAAYTQGAAVPKITAENYAERLVSYFGPKAGAMALKQYPLAKYPDPGAAFGQAAGDASLACPALAGATAMEAYTPVHLYQFDREPNPFVLPMPGIELGAFHAAELPFVFGTSTQSSGTIHFDQSQQKLSDAMLSSWTAFARTGNPSIPGVDWPTANAAPHRHIVFDSPIHGGTAIKADECAMWKNSGFSSSKAGRS